ncbi:MAG: NAD-dependent deacylase [candidate division Zixibacteria bacterium]|nr:NAD-dependent deacylase [candidate division Zixibacteria bacterium]
MQTIEFEDRFLEALKNSTRVAALTGAGVSAESGVPTFRGEDGLWKKHNPMELATFEAFNSNPKLVWEWYDFRRNIIRKIKPNPGHFALAEMAKLYENFTLITQNVDRLHMAAGSPEIHELHGNIHRNRCLDCGKMDYTEGFDEIPPKCACGGRLRPDVVWFGEMLPAETLEKSMLAAHNSELFFTIGTSGAIYPAAGLPGVAKKNGALVVEVNLEPSEISHVCDIKYHGKSGEILPQIVNKIKELRQS